MFKYKCKDCGKIYENKPEKCSCGGESGFVEIEVVEVEKVVEKEVDLDAVKKQAKEELEADYKKQLEDDKVKIKADLEEQIAKELKEKLMKDIEDEKNLNENQLEIKKIKAELEATRKANETYKESIDLLINKQKADSEEMNRLKLKDEIADKVKKEEWMKDIALDAFSNGNISSIEDYEKLVNSVVGKTAKEAYELKKKVEGYGQDPASEYSKEKKKKEDKKTELKLDSEKENRLSKLFGGYSQ